MAGQAATFCILFILVAACASPTKSKRAVAPRAEMLSASERSLVAQGYLDFYRFGLSEICDIKDPPEKIIGLSSVGLPDVVFRKFDPHHKKKLKAVTGASVDLRTDNKDQTYHYFGKEENKLIPRKRELYLILMGTKVRPQYHFCSQSKKEKTNCHLDEFMTLKEDVCGFITAGGSLVELQEEQRLQSILDLWSSVQLTKSGPE